MRELLTSMFFKNLTSNSPQIYSVRGGEAHARVEYERPSGLVRVGKRGGEGRGGGGWACLKVGQERGCVERLGL